MSKKILVISPTPSHPQNAGNRSRIYRLLLSLKEMRYDVHFLHIKETLGDEAAMEKCWGDKFYSLTYNQPETKVKKKPKTLKQRIIKKIVRIIKSLINNDPQFNYLIDDWYDDSVDQKIIELSKKISPEVILVEYVFFSKALELFDKNAIKIIDTHDIFHNRYKLYQRNKRTPEWFSTSKAQEIKGLNRADIIIAIQEQEEKLFSRFLKSKEIVTVGHLVDLQKFIPRNLSYKILFVGSSNSINVDGIEYFIKDIFPKIKTKFKEAKLVLAGDICNVIEDFDGCCKLGRVQNLKEAYDAVDLAINPVQYGTGLNIKNIEALGYSKPLVTTSKGAEGMEHGNGTTFLIADSAIDFANHIIEIFSNNNTYENLAKKSYEFAFNWNQNYLQVLNKIISV